MLAVGELLVVVAEAAAKPPGELVDMIGSLGGGAAGTFALVAWWWLRRDRSARGDRQRELDERLERMATTLARIDERTTWLIGELGAVPKQPMGKVRSRPVRKPRDPDAE